MYGAHLHIVNTKGKEEKKIQAKLKNTSLCEFCKDFVMYFCLQLCDWLFDWIRYEYSQ